ncbi:MAG TPA: hypothetical protein VHS99_19740 [Chloroflexota bacterium]|jgi:hypothetical protein|nr:hypothetical protein [Chloroflexota bacterium]
MITKQQRAQPARVAGQEKGKPNRQRRLRLLRPARAVGRPTTILEAAIQRWRGLFVEPIWRIEVSWARGLESRYGERTRVAQFPQGRVLRLDVDSALSAAAAERAVIQALATVHISELRVQCQAVVTGAIRNPLAREAALRRHRQLFSMPASSPGVP